jgi:uncharacterized membrane protein
VTAGLKPTRMECLTDGVFAIAMTLLVIDLKVPHGGDHSSAEIVAHLRGHAANVLGFLTSFVILGVCWIGHHIQFDFVRRVDRPLLWINVLFLMAVAFLPFSTALLAAHFHAVAAVLLYGLNLAICSGLLLWHWSYITANPGIHDGALPPGIAAEVRKRLLWAPAVALGAMAVSPFSPATAAALFLLIPLRYIPRASIDRFLRS